MSKKIAVAIIHGVGKQDKHFADGMAKELKTRFAKYIQNETTKARNQLVIHPIYWAPVIQKQEDELWRRMKAGGDLDFTALRRFIIDFAADAIAYQPAPTDRRVYDSIHQVFAKTLHKLAQDAGATAPLCVIAHSLGSVIASNYLYDLQAHFSTNSNREIISRRVLPEISETKIEYGKTLTLFYTLGSPIALWSLRFKDFGKPIEVPSPELETIHPNLGGEWINFYDKDDVIGYPLKTLNEAYGEAVKEDRSINVGGIISSWNPASHLKYWTDDDVTIPISKALAEKWISLNS